MERLLNGFELFDVAANQTITVNYNNQDPPWIRGDANGDGMVDIADPVSLLNFRFAGGPSPVAPFPDSGPGTLPADQELGCANPPDCQ